ncbi:MAG: hypothetical protein DMF82_14520 [Acidobacteria bacterium]|nr:MAG: hypothetical protein DMF82_14520 [Acidobacteriota bacterium]
MVPIPSCFGARSMRPAKRSGPRRTSYRPSGSRRTTAPAGGTTAAAGSATTMAPRFEWSRPSSSRRLTAIGELDRLPGKRSVKRPVGGSYATRAAGVPSPQYTVPDGPTSRSRRYWRPAIAGPRLFEMPRAGS